MRGLVVDEVVVEDIGTIVMFLTSVLINIFYNKV